MQAIPLFKGLTRPPMIFGVPIVPLFVAMGAIFLISFYTQNIFMTILSVPVYFVMKQMAKKDDFIFHLLFLKMKFFTNPFSKKFHNVKTYSANHYNHKQNSKNFIPKLSLFHLNAEPNFEKLIPFSSIIDEGVVITKDYLFVATYEIEGISFETKSDEELDFKNEALNMLFKSFANESVSFYFHNIRHKIEKSLQSNFTNSYLKELDEKYYEIFKDGALYKNSLFLSIVYNPISKLEKQSFKKLSLMNKSKELKSYLQKFKELILRLEANLNSFEAKRLCEYEENGNLFSKQLEFYNYLLGGKFSKVRLLKSPIYEYLTGNLNSIYFNYDMAQLNYNDENKKFVRAVEIKDYSSEVHAGILNVLMYLDIEYTITQSFQTLARIDAKSALDKQRKQLIASEDDAISQVEQLDFALDSLAGGELSFGKYHFEMLIYGDTPKECKDNANTVITKLNELGFMASIANVALPSAYFSTLPCNFSLRPRVNLLSSLNYSALIALHNFNRGKKNKNCWGEAVSMLKTRSKSPYYLNFHQSGGKNKDDFGEFLLANTLILGQSSGGKTVFMNFSFNQMLKYADKNTFPNDLPDEKKQFTAVYLDKDKGALGNILCAGGRYISIENGKPTSFNPFMVESTPENIRALKNIITLCVTRKGEILNTKEEKKLSDAVDFIMTQFEVQERKYPISLLLENLTEDVNDDNSLKSRLLAFKQGKQFGWVFDNEFDNLDFPDSINVFGIDGTEFLDDSDVNGILSYFILWRVMNLADGRRLVIDIDEAWKWLENDIVANEVKNKFKTIRKQNGFLRLATQSVEDFLKLPIAKTIIEQSATKIFLPNPQAREEDYVGGLNLSFDEYEIIKNFQPENRNLLVKRQDESVIANFNLSSLGKENLMILSTGTAFIDTIETIFKQENKSLDEKIAELKKFYKEQK
ncbi:VirB4 family type IV secretion/conjugal transfer ATPase [Campylobacter helveticus]|uniref:VirB4 family type IV secretion/conjugal transfer ATPase n=1 Tax=Campylobacter helveticus TaxID=28898 RepID=UPI00111739BD|nr:VirB4 family type IV secretion/conjugal transfer ATPase [Campylobacter helveticus]TNH32464.1 VirB4 family type IV secretion/conjugal transfer ATPase [Campylobacter helveticus]